MELNNYLASFVFMKKEIFNEVLAKVAEVMDVERVDVLRCNREECVDARYVVIAVLSVRFSDRVIAEMGGWSVQLVNKARNSFHERCRWRWGLKEVYKKMCIFAP